MIFLERIIRREKINDLRDFLPEDEETPQETYKNTPETILEPLRGK